jgi:hypothetical protein
MKVGPAVVALALSASLAWPLACSSSDDTTPPPAADSGPAPAVPRPPTTDPVVLRGWQSVLSRDCPSCHQPPDASDGILSGQTSPRPGTTAYAPNLTPDPDTGLDGWSATAIANAMRKGVDIDGIELCPTMPRFSDMKDDEAAAIASYLQFLTAVHHPIPESVCPPIKVPHVDDAGEDAGIDGSAADASDAGASDAANDALDAAD